MTAERSWSDPETVAANAEGRLTPAQWAEVAGPAVVATRVGAVVLVAGLVVVITVGWFGVGGVWSGVGAVAVAGISIGTGSWRIRDRLRRRRRIARLAEPDIRSDVGMVFAHPGGWSGVTTAATAVALPEDAPPPPPGRYLLYWLGSGTSEPGRLLSVEPLGREAPVRRSGFPDPEAPRIRSLLLSAAGCDDRDLADNRAGRLSRGQRTGIARQLRITVARWGLVCAAATAILGGPVVLSGFGVARAISRGDTDDAASHLCGAVLGLALASAVPFAVAEMVVAWRDGRGILRAPAPVECAVTEVDVHDRCRVQLRESGQYLVTSAEMVRVFLVEPGLYTVYYLRCPEDVRMLSAEPVAVTRSGRDCPDRRVCLPCVGPVTRSPAGR